MGLKAKEERFRDLLDSVTYHIECAERAPSKRETVRWLRSAHDQLSAFIIIQEMVDE